MVDWLNLISPVLNHPRYNYWGEVSPGWVEPERIIYNHQLVMVSEGEVSVEVEDRKYFLGKDSFIIIPSGVRHLSRNDGKSLAARHWLHFDWVFQEELGETPAYVYLPGEVSVRDIHDAPDFVPQEIFHGKIEDPEYVFSQHQRICLRLRGASAHGSFNCRGLVLDLLTELLDQRSRSLGEGSWEEHLAKQVRDKLDDIVSRSDEARPSIQATLSTVGRSYAHLARLFRKTYGISPLTYVNNSRLERSKFLLKQSSDPISEIAAACGFETTAYFTRSFRRHTGYSPSEFRTRESIEI